MNDLATTQRRLWRLLSAPDGVRAALAEAGDASGATLSEWLTTGETAPATRRLEVYANAYFQRIHDVLAEDFGELAAALGELGFHDLVTAYLCVHPSEHASLRHVGARLPGFLGQDPAAAPFRARWPFAADLARFACARNDAFDAPDAIPLSGDSLARIPPERWEALTFSLMPGVQRLDLAFDVTASGRPPAEATAILVWRKTETVMYRKLAREERELFDALAAGETFGGLCERLAETHGAGAAPARAAGWLASWLEARLLCAS